MVKIVTKKNNKTTKKPARQSSALVALNADIARMQKIIKNAEARGADTQLADIVLRSLKKRKKGSLAGKPVFGGKDEYATLTAIATVWQFGGTDVEACLHAHVAVNTLQHYYLRMPELKELRTLIRATPTLLARKAVMEGLKFEEGRVADYRFALDVLKGTSTGEGVGEDIFTPEHEQDLDNAFDTLLLPEQQERYKKLKE